MKSRDTIGMLHQVSHQENNRGDDDERGNELKFIVSMCSHE